MTQKDRLRLAMAADCTEQSVRNWESNKDMGRRLKKALDAAAKRLGIERVEK